MESINKHRALTHRRQGKNTIESRNRKLNVSTWRLKSAVQLCVWNWNVCRVVGNNRNNNYNNNSRTAAAAATTKAILKCWTMLQNQLFNTKCLYSHSHITLKKSTTKQSWRVRMSWFGGGVVWTSNDTLEMRIFTTLSNTRRHREWDRERERERWWNKRTVIWNETRR